MAKSKLSQYKIVTYPNPILLKRSEEIPVVNSETKQLVKDMFLIMYAEGGVGLAAPLIGISERLFVVNPEGKKGGPEFTFINPILSEPQGQVAGPEGCLSLPGISGDVVRAKKITVNALNEKGKPVQFAAEEFLARILQHENDHLDGKLFIDRLSFAERQKLLAEYESGLTGKADTALDENRIFRIL